jgi:hypothetical protein
MTITIDLPATIEAQFRLEAAQNGVGLDNYLANVLKKVARTRAKRATKPLYDETALLKKINLAISTEEWAAYRKLVKLRQAETLTAQEHEQLILLGDKIEQANAQRLKYLLELAKLRGVALDKLIVTLGITPLEL